MSDYSLYHLLTSQAKNKSALSFCHTSLQAMPIYPKNKEMFWSNLLEIESLIEKIIADNLVYDQTADYHNTLSPTETKEQTRIRHQKLFDCIKRQMLCAIELGNLVFRCGLEYSIKASEDAKEHYMMLKIEHAIMKASDSYCDSDLDLGWFYFGQKLHSRPKFWNDEITELFVMTANLFGNYDSFFELGGDYQSEEQKIKGLDFHRARIEFDMQKILHKYDAVKKDLHF